MWKCSGCNEEHDDQFEECWQCGATKTAGIVIPPRTSEPPVGEDHLADAGSTSATAAVARSAPGPANVTANSGGPRIDAAHCLNSESKSDRPQTVQGGDRGNGARTAQRLLGQVGAGAAGEVGEYLARRHKTLHALAKFTEIAGWLICITIAFIPIGLLLVVAAQSILVNVEVENNTRRTNALLEEILLELKSNSTGA